MDDAGLVLTLVFGSWFVISLCVAPIIGRAIGIRPEDHDGI